MTLGRQILAGGVVLAACALVHIAVLAGGIEFLQWTGLNMQGLAETLRWLTLIVGAFGFVVLGHTLQIWMWAFSLIWIRSLQRMDDAVYFALVTTTTLGYGDITLQREHRVFGAMSAVTGLLTFGLSTAFLIGFMGALFSDFAR